MELAARACPFLRNSTPSALRSLSHQPAKTASNGLVGMAQQCPVMGKAMTIQARASLMASGGANACPGAARHFSASATKARPAKSQVLGYASAVSSNDLKASVQHELHKANPAPGAGMFFFVIIVVVSLGGGWRLPIGVNIPPVGYSVYPFFP